ncbi:SRPBCC domain-containing protein, partial [Rhizobium leguminosarum]|uniref:SRPBCC family protein n=1 Tax=Rhizobium leguminosarum TaxID=384 RepID=UPI003F95BD3E
VRAAPLHQRFRVGPCPENQIASGEKSPEKVVNITFRESDGGTEMTFRQSGFESASSLEGHEAGWSQSLERLSFFLGTESEGPD